MFKIYSLTFLSALALSFVFVPTSIWISKKMNVFDLPDPRKVHGIPTPRWGGLGIALSFVGSIFVSYFLFPRFAQLLTFRHKIIVQGDVIGQLTLKGQLTGALLGGLFVLGVGMWDDKSGISAKVKLPLQIIASYIALDYGVRISGLTMPFSSQYILFPLIASQFITLLWLTGFMNTINLADGLDGLAAGICAIASATFLIVAVIQGDTEILWFSKQLKLAGLLSAALCGASLGFLWFNFYPAKVFMGDGGALFLGFMLAVIAVLGTLKSAAFFALLIPVLVVALPVIDVVFSILRRIFSNRQVFAADNGHIHHRWLQLGWSHREVVLGVYVITLGLSLFAIFLALYKLQKFT